MYFLGGIIVVFCSNDEVLCEDGVLCVFLLVR